MKIEDVERVYDALLAAGIKPSLRKVIDELGYGSMTDARRLVEQVRIRRQQEADATSAIPAHVRNVSERFVAQLWSALDAEADIKVAAVRTAADQRIEEARQIETEAVQDVDRLQAELNEIRAQLSALSSRYEMERGRSANLEKELAVARSGMEDARVRADALQASLDLALRSSQARPVLPEVFGLAAYEMEFLFAALVDHIEQGLSANQNRLEEISDFSPSTLPVASKAVEALVEFGLLLRDEKDNLTLPTSR